MGYKALVQRTTYGRNGIFFYTILYMEKEYAKIMKLKKRILSEVGVVVMKCPYCSYTESKVIDSRPAEEGASIRRRRECLACQCRFTTYEIMERLPLVVVKRDGSRQTFDKNKLIRSMLKACEKRSVALEELEQIANEIEQELQNALEREIPTSEVGELVMKRLQVLDEVAYVRFASVYRQFKDLNTFMEELTRLLGEKT